MEVQLKTASTRTDPTDYWDDEFLDTIEYVQYTSKTVGYVWDGVDEVERIMEQADHTDFVIRMEPGVTKWKNADIAIIVYDGYME